MCFCLCSETEQMLERVQRMHDVHTETANPDLETSCSELEQVFWRVQRTRALRVQRVLWDVRASIWPREVRQLLHALVVAGDLMCLEAQVDVLQRWGQQRQQGCSV